MYYADETILSKQVIKTHYIVRVMAVHPENQTVDVMQAVLQYGASTNGHFSVINDLGYEAKADLVEPFVIYGVPVVQQRWGQFSIQCCPKVGDEGYIEVMVDDIDTWKKKGSPAIPTNAFKFKIKHCVFVPFVANDTTADPDYPTENTKLVIKSDNLRIELNDDGQEPHIDITGDTNIEGNLTIKGDISIEGDIESKGDIKVEGDVEVKGDIKVTNGDVTADGISLKNHTHSFNYIGAGQGSTPQSGTTQGAQ